MTVTGVDKLPRPKAKSRPKTRERHAVAEPVPGA